MLTNVLDLWISGTCKGMYPFCSLHVSLIHDPWRKQNTEIVLLLANMDGGKQSKRVVILQVPGPVESNLCNRMEGELGLS